MAEERENGGDFTLVSHMDNWQKKHHGTEREYIWEAFLQGNLFVETAAKQQTRQMKESDMVGEGFK